MKPLHALLLALLGLVPPSGIAVAIMHRPPARGTVYSVAAVQAHLADDPQRWAGRTLLLRGEAVPCSAIPSAGGALCVGLAPAPPPPAAATMLPLPVARVGAPPILVFLHRVPLAGRMLPAPQELRLGAVATYRVRLQAVPGSLCGVGACYEAVLPDAAP